MPLGHHCHSPQPPPSGNDVDYVVTTSADLGREKTLVTDYETLVDAQKNLDPQTVVYRGPMDTQTMEELVRRKNAREEIVFIQEQRAKTADLKIFFIASERRYAVGYGTSQTGRTTLGELSLTTA